MIFAASSMLAELAKRLGAKVENPVGYDPQSGRFYTAEEYARNKAVLDEAQIVWLLNMGQQADAALTPVDEVMFRTFVGRYASTVPDAEPDALHRIATEVVAAMRRFVVDHAAWDLQLPRITRTIEWLGAHQIASFRTDDWQTAFRLRAADLVSEYADRIGQCKRDDCKRLFFAADKRQVFCSRLCSQKTQFEKYVKSIGGKKAWRKKHREQYHKRKRSAAKNETARKGE